MLVYASISKWGQKPGVDVRVKDSTNGTPFLLNGNRIQGLEARGSKCKFMYGETMDVREKASYVEAEEAVSTIIADMNKTFQTNTLPLLLHTGNVSTGATFTRYILGDSIIFAHRDQDYPATKSRLSYMESGKRIEVLCAYSLKQIRELADTADLTTT